MLSSDKNVETIAELVEVLKHYSSLQIEFLKLTLIDKVVRLFTAIALAILFIIIIIAVLLFFWFAVAYWLSAYIGVPGAFLAIAIVHVLVLTLFFVFRKTWIERPLVRFLAHLLMS